MKMREKNDVQKVEQVQNMTEDEQNMTEETMYKREGFTYINKLKFSSYVEQLK